MKVKLISWTGQFDTRYQYGEKGQSAARLLCYIKNTRLTQGDETRNRYWEMPWEDIQKELAEVANTIRSAWEFVDFTFEIQGVTRAFTHQLVRTRVGVSFAQQAMRVADMANFDVLTPESVLDSKAHGAWFDAINSIRFAYRELRANGVPAQDARGLLPTNVHTNIIMRINLRALADMIPKRDNARVQDEYNRFVRFLEARVLEEMPWAAPFLRPERTSTPALEAVLREALGNRSPVDAPAINDALKELDRLKGTWG